MIAKVAGVRVREKDGKKSWTLQAIVQFDDYAIDNGAIGFEVKTFWTNRCDCSNMRPDDVVRLFFVPGFDDKATLDSYQTVDISKTFNPFSVINLPDGKISADAGAASTTKK